MPELRVEADYDVGKARRAVVKYSQQLGMSERNLSDIAIIATELATNLVRHANRGGTIRYSSSADHGLILEASDDGPGITDVQNSMTDGVSSKRSLGGGLGAVQRLSDHFTLETGVQGTTIITHKYLEAHQKQSLSVGVVSRPYPGYLRNGDGFFIQQKPTKNVIGLFDALGHGDLAYEAANLLLRSLQENVNLSLEQMIQLSHERLKRSRGAVLFLAVITKSELKYIGIGNIEAILGMEGMPSKRLMSYRGVIGASLSEFKVTTLPWNPGSWLLLHTDGISGRMDSLKNVFLEGGAPGMVCRQIVEDYGRNNDDASVLIAREEL